MSLPPPPGPYGSQPPTGGQPGGGQPWQSQGGGPDGPPPQASQPWQQQGGGQSGPPPEGPPSWAPQQQWSGGAPPAPPQKGGGKAKWILGGLAIVLAIALTAVVTVLIVRPSGGGEKASPATSADGAKSEFASANDTGPVNIITEDPTCDAWGGVARAFVSAEQSVNWSDRDYKVAATNWTPDQRAMYETVSNATTSAANKTKNLAKQTPHRVMRELYGQFIAYAETFTNLIPQYTESEYQTAGAFDGISSAVSAICSAIAYHSAGTVAPLLSVPDAPSTDAADAGSVLPKAFLVNTNPKCEQWESSAREFASDVSEWRAIDPNIARADWTPAQKSIMDAVGPIMSSSADLLNDIGRASNNSTFEDFATLAAQYRRAYVAALSDYSPADNFLSSTSTYIVNSVLSACRAAA